MVLGLFGAAERNAERRRNEGKLYEQAKKQWRQESDNYQFQKDQYEAQIKNNESNLRFQEEGLIRDYEYNKQIRDYEFNFAQQAYERSVSQAQDQKNFNALAQSTAIMQQDLKKHDDLLSTMFEESDSMLSYLGSTAGLEFNKTNAINQANFQGANVDTKFVGNLANRQLQRRTMRGEVQNETQKLIVQGMKLAGQIRARGGSGRSAEKAVLGVMAESGAARSAIANGLMYAEKGIDIGIAQLKDMLILDQTMVLAAHHLADNEYSLKKGGVDATRGTDKIKISATKQSIEARDAIVRDMISNARRQADMKAEASIMMQPQRLPEPIDPRVAFAKYDNPDTADYVEMLLRPQTVDFPDYIDEPRRKDFRGARENVGLSNFADVLKIGGGILGGIGTLGAAGALGGFGLASTANNGTLATLYSGIGAGLSNLGSSFYPRR